MGQVYKFPGGEGEETEGRALSALRLRRNSRTVAVTVLRSILEAMRLPVFLVLYWLRFPVSFVCKFLVGGGLLAAIIAYVVSPYPKMLWGFSLISFSAFVFMWAYDLVLMYLSPQEMVQTL